ncbi:MAG TPA: cytochrome c [Prolixibacteraceae bacterium]
MNRIANKVVLSVLLIVFFISCQSGGDKKKAGAAGQEQAPKEITGNQPVQTAEKVHKENDVYKKYCLVCHQANGSGVPGMYPPLGPGSWVGNDPKELVTHLLQGLKGKIEVNGEIYNSLMPAQVQMTDEEIAEVLTYIRSDFGNSFGPVDVELVKKVRGGK